MALEIKVILIILLILLFVIAAEVLLYLISNGRADLSFVIKAREDSQEFKDKEKTRQEALDWIKEQKTVEYCIKSFDGLNLYATFLPAKKADDRYVICQHGIQSYGVWEFAYIAKCYHEAGINVLIPDQRGCGKSEGKYVTYGYNESKDACDWIKFAAGEFGADAKIYLHGLSLGSSTSMMAAGSNPKQLCGVIADCGYTSASKQIKDTLESVGVPKIWGYNLYKIACICHRIYNPDDCVPKKALTTTKVPFLFSHGDNDTVVAYSNMEEAYEACASTNKEMFTVNGAGHTLDFYMSQKYRDKVIDFIK